MSSYQVRSLRYIIMLIILLSIHIPLFSGDLDDLADLIEAASKNYSISLPTTVLTILRTILYLLNGNNAECVSISTDGFTENKNIFASSATWKGVKLKEQYHFLIILNCTTYTVEGIVYTFLMGWCMFILGYVSFASERSLHSPIASAHQLCKCVTMFTIHTCGQY